MMYHLTTFFTPSKLLLKRFVIEVLIDFINSLKMFLTRPGFSIVTKLLIDNLQPALGLDIKMEYLQLAQFLLFYSLQV